VRIDTPVAVGIARELSVCPSRWSSRSCSGPISATRRR
jgi:hypothetical protein